MAIDLEQNTRSSGSVKIHVDETEHATEKMGSAAAQTSSEANGVTLGSFNHLDEKKILRKMDLHIIPMLTLLYLLSYLDRELSN